MWIPWPLPFLLLLILIKKIFFSPVFLSDIWYGQLQRLQFPIQFVWSVGSVQVEHSSSSCPFRTLLLFQSFDWTIQLPKAALVQTVDRVSLSLFPLSLLLCVCAPIFVRTDPSGCFVNSTVHPFWNWQAPTYRLYRLFWGFWKRSLESIETKRIGSTFSVSTPIELKITYWETPIRIELDL